MSEANSAQDRETGRAPDWSRLGRQWVLATALGWLVGAILSQESLILAPLMTALLGYEELVFAILTALALALAGTLSAAAQWLV